MLEDLACVQDGDQKNIGTQMTCLGVRIPDMTVKVNMLCETTNEWDGRETSWAMLEELIDLDDNFENWVEGLPKLWKYETLTGMKGWLGENAYEDAAHVYMGMWLTSLWNSYRMLRVALNISMLRLLEHISKTWPSCKLGHRLASCKFTLRQLANDVCASVPYLVGDSGTSTSDTAVRYPNMEGLWDSELHARECQRSGIGPVSLIFPLLFCLRILILPPQQRLWIQDQLARLQHLIKSGPLSMLFPERLSPDNLPYVVLNRAVNAFDIERRSTSSQSSKRSSLPSAGRAANKYRCTVEGCSAPAFSTSSNFYRHRREQHGMAQAFPCRFCKHVFTRAEARRVHLERGCSAS